MKLVNSDGAFLAKEEAKLKELKSKKETLIEYYLGEGKLNKKGINILHSNSNRQQDIKDAKAILEKAKELELSENEIKVLEIIVSGEIIEESTEFFSSQAMGAIA